MKTYEHYGSSHLVSKKVNAKGYAHKQKPDKGIWGSPVDSKNSWKNWVTEEEFDCDLSKVIKFSLRKEAKILEIHKEEDIEPYLLPDPVMEAFCPNSKYKILNREKLYADYDGIELFLSENPKLRNGFFNYWDVDSICVWNPDVIIRRRNRRRRED